MMNNLSLYDRQTTKATAGSFALANGIRIASDHSDRVVDNVGSCSSSIASFYLQPNTKEWKVWLDSPKRTREGWKDYVTHSRAQHRSRSSNRCKSWNRVRMYGEHWISIISDNAVNYVQFTFLFEQTRLSAHMRVYWMIEMSFSRMILE